MYLWLTSKASTLKHPSRPGLSQLELAQSLLLISAWSTSNLGLIICLVAVRADRGCWFCCDMCWYNQWGHRLQWNYILILYGAVVIIIGCQGCTDTLAIILGTIWYAGICWNIQGWLSQWLRVRPKFNFLILYTSMFICSTDLPLDLAQHYNS